MSFDQTDKAILQALADGYTAKEIADQVHLSTDAVKDRLEKWRHRLKCRNSAHLAYSYGLLQSIQFYGPSK